MKIRPNNWIKTFIESKPGRYLTDPNSSAAVKIATVSNLTKDGVNCIYYVTQSLNNERIPEDKRKFVAGLDLANGILNVTLQAFVGKMMEEYTGIFFDKKVAPKYFNQEKYKEMWKGLENKVKFEEFVSQMERNKGFAKNGLKVISALVAMQVITKRIIVPLIATPLASVFKKQFEKGEENKKAAEQNKKIANA